MRSVVASVGNATEVLRYLEAVYPAAGPHLAQLTADELHMWFRNLDYFYSIAEGALSSVRPHLSLALRAGVRIPSQVASRGRRTTIPYLPPGAYYRATGEAPLDRGKFNAVMWGSFDRHEAPVDELAMPLKRPQQVAHFHSSFGARLGPQPSWTSPFAIVRYVLHPSGLETTSKAHATAHGNSTTLLRKASLKSPGSSHFDLTNMSRISELRRLRDGDAIEVELWGGLLTADECPPICGLWANIWRGTGVMLRVRNPFVSLSKMTALVEMFAALGERNRTAIVALVEHLGAFACVQRMRTQHPSAMMASLLSACMLAEVPIATGLIHRNPDFARLSRAWSDLARRSTPEAIVGYALGLGNGAWMPGAMLSGLSYTDRFALYWLFGIAGKARGTTFWKASQFGPDGLLAGLACILGHHTIVLAASPNDNGLLHQELVDFELPFPLGWQSATGNTNDVGWCLSQRAFSFLADDARKGVGAQNLRRVHMLKFWQSEGKFRIPLTPGGGTGSHASAPCQIAFGRGDGPNGVAGEVAACRGPKVRVPRPIATKTCYAWCNGTLSQHALAHASLGHVRHRIEREEIRPPARSHEWVLGSTEHV